MDSSNVHVFFDRYMDFPAQSVKCHLNGIARKNASTKMWSQIVMDCLTKLAGKMGDIFIESPTFGVVGRLPELTELALSVVL